MTMSMCGPGLTTTRYNRKQKLSKSKKLAKAQAEHEEYLKKLGVKISVDKDPFGDGYDELNYSGDKAAILKLASISGHDQDITGGPDEGGYWITETVSDKPKTIELNEGMSIAEKFARLMNK